MQRINIIQGIATVSNATCAEVLAGPDSKTYRVTGTVTKIVNTTYGNWYLNDGTGEVYIYGTLDSKGGTKNFLHEPAMSETEFDQAIEVGSQLVDECYTEGCNIICIGEMGIANTSPSSIWMHLFGNVPLDECIGVGAGLDSPGLKHKREVLHQAVDRFINTTSFSFHDKLSTKETEHIIRYFGGFEMVAAIGAMLHAAEQKMLVMVDGFIMSACALAACMLEPNVLDYMIFGHCGDESGHKRMLSLMNAQPLLQLSLRLGEGTGALCSYSIIQSAVNMINEMNNFDNAKITKYF